VPKGEPFAYALLRVVPDLDRGEQVNAGVVLFCRRTNFLRALTALPAERLRVLDPDLDLAPIDAHLHALERIAAGDPTGGPIAGQPPSERFHWLVAPASTVVQPGPVHTGVTEDAQATLQRLFATLVC